MLNVIACLSFVIRNQSFLSLTHQSFVSSAPLGPGNSGAFNFSIFKFQIGKILIIPAKSPDSLEADNNVEQQLGVVLMELKYQRGD